MTQNTASGLWKFVQLTRQSAYFPALVEGAARAAGRVSDDGMLAHVAAQAAVTDLIEMTLDGSIDPGLEHVLTTNGAALDAAIRAAVDSYPAPTA